MEAWHPVLISYSGSLRGQCTGDEIDKVDKLSGLS